MKGSVLVSILYRVKFESYRIDVQPRIRKINLKAEKPAEKIVVLPLTIYKLVELL